MALASSTVKGTTASSTREAMRLFLMTVIGKEEGEPPESSSLAR